MARVILIEDEVDQVELYRLALGVGGHEVLAAGAWIDDVRCARREQPDLVILDERLRGRSGASLIPRLRADFPGARILLLTADPDVAGDACARGADEGLLKPVSLRRLLARIGDLLSPLDR